jgi:hypothetical protein
MKAPVPVPQDQLGWLREIAAAYCDAQEAIPFGRLIGEPIAEGDLFHLASRVALKFRGLRASPRNLKKATEAALVSYVANKERQPEEFADPRLAFAFCYLAGHYGLGLVEAGDVDQLMEFVEERRSDLRALTGGVR